MNNLKLIRENIHLVENVKLFTEVNKQIFDKIISKIKSNIDIDIDNLEIDNQLIEKINKFAPIKYILKNKSQNDNDVFAY